MNDWITCFQTPHRLPMKGSGLGPGMPCSEKTWNVEVPYLPYVGKMQVKLAYRQD